MIILDSSDRLIEKKYEDLPQVSRKIGNKVEVRAPQKIPIMGLVRHSRSVKKGDQKRGRLQLIPIQRH